MNNEVLLAPVISDDIDQWLHGRPVDFLAYLRRVFSDTDLGIGANDFEVGLLRVAE